MENDQVLDIAQRMSASASQGTEAVLMHQRPCDPSCETVLGTLPEHLRPLAVLHETLSEECRAAHEAWSETEDDTDEYAQALARLEDLKRDQEALSAVLWASIERGTPNDRERYSGKRLTSDWEIVGVHRSTEEEAMAELMRYMADAMRA